jgi:hypothetical protein
MTARLLLIPEKRAVIDRAYSRPTLNAKTVFDL